jgi:hypothetical protein
MRIYYSSPISREASSRGHQPPSTESARAKSILPGSVAEYFKKDRIGSWEFRKKAGSAHEYFKK